MEQKTEIAKYITRTAQEKAYDESVKRILSTRYLLAWIMKGCVTEYQNFSIREIAERFIEGEPQVSNVSVHPGDPNSLIHGIDTADKSLEEHTTLYDVLFYASLPDSSEKIGLFINIEAQNRYNPGYPLTKRGIYYCSRMLSAQFGRDFADGHYENLKKVYSIWICTNVPNSRSNTITQYEMTEKHLLGMAGEERKNYDLLSVVMVCFNDRHIPERLDNRPGTNADESTADTAAADLVRLLSVLMSSRVTKEDKRHILSEEYDIPMTKELEEEVFHMCNVSQSVKEQGIAEGFEKGILQEKSETALKMLQKQFPAAMIMELTALSLEDIQKIAAENQLTVVYHS